MKHPRELLRSNGPQNLIITGGALYTAALACAILLLIFEPNGFSATAMIVPLVLALFLGALGLTSRLFGGTDDPILRIAGRVLIAIVLAWIGFFIVVAIGWLIAVSHASIR